MKRRRRNSPYGATEAEYRHVRGNPSRSSKSGVLLGHLDELVFDLNGEQIKASKHNLQGLFVAWFPETRDFGIVYPKQGKPGRLSPEVVRVHRQFHNSDPRTATTYHLPSDRSGMLDVGLITSLTYVIPSWMHSPQKTGFKWVHLFGDHGESGHGSFRGGKSYAHTFKPMLQMNAAGEPFIKRRPGNKYTVTDWIFW